MVGGAVNGLPLWRDPVATGPENMAADEVLAAEAERLGRPVARVYGWAPSTVSLGAFQPVVAARATADLSGLPLVRRPSGGGAILHGSDATYAVAVPAGHRWARSPQALYDAVHAALVAVLVGRGVPARQHPGRGAAGGDEERLLCFDRRATGDVVVATSDGPGDPDGAKILGSAQRRLQGAVLQHGALLLTANVDVPSGIRHPGLRDLWAAVIGDEAGLVAEWFVAVAAADGREVDPQPQPFAAGRSEEIRRRSERFRQPRWTDRR